MYSRLFDKEKTQLSDEVWECIKNNQWEGNIREFSNFIKNYVLFGTVTKINNYHSINPNKNEDNTYLFINHNFHELEEVKYWLIDKALKKFNGNKTLAAKHLGLSYQGLVYLLKKTDV